MISKVIQVNFQELKDMSFGLKGLTKRPGELIKVDTIPDSA